ncbi:hypothetical protein NITHO_2400015 [Nitrolancea hollandica Lb]|uniref:Uncharacterized protein n=1 Tax=Nitrolancea hollandica Lb TaxID=1129897 RepID=I4EFU3_9BACT|nr:hypothetical protein NITHO_2400015 [Nitrolancea hollandica Lb]
MAILSKPFLASPQGTGPLRGHTNGDENSGDHAHQPEQGIGDHYYQENLLAPAPPARGKLGVLLGLRRFGWIVFRLMRFHLVEISVP